VVVELGVGIPLEPGSCALRRVVVGPAAPAHRRHSPDTVRPVLRVSLLRRSRLVGLSRSGPMGRKIDGGLVVYGLRKCGLPVPGLGGRQPHQMRPSYYVGLFHLAGGVAVGFELQG